MNGLHVLGPVVLLLPGAGLLAVFGARGDRPLAVRAAWAFVAGVAYTGLVLFAASELLSVPLRSAQVRAVLLVPVALGCVALWRRRSLPARGRLGLTAAFVVIPLLLVGGPLLLESVAVPLADGDGRVTWSAQARHMRFEASVTPSAIREAGWFVHHPEYPPLMPVVQVAILEALRLGDDDRAVRPVYAAFLFALVIVAADVGSTLGGRTWGALAAGLLALLPAMSGEAGGAAGAYSDLPLAVFWGGAFLLLLDGRRSRGDTLLAALLLAAAVAAKNEGLLYALTVLAACGLHRRSRRGIVSVVFAVVCAGLLVAARKHGIENRLDSDFEGRVLSGLPVREALDRLSLAVPEALGVLSAAPWRGAAIFFAVTGIAGAALFRRRPAQQMATGAVLAVAVPLVGYAFSPYPPVWLAKTTADRFLVHLALPATALLAMAMREAVARRSIRPTAYAGAAAALALAVSSVTKGALPFWPEASPCPCTSVEVLEEDPSLPAWLDRPAEAGVARGDLLVSGWCFDETAPCSVLDVEIDGVRRRCVRFRRVERPDVAAALNRPGPIGQVGFEAVYRFDDSDAGDHELLVRVWSPAGRSRTFRRRFEWAPGSEGGKVDALPGDATDLGRPPR